MDLKLELARCGRCRVGLSIVDRVGDKIRLPAQCPSCQLSPQTWEIITIWGPVETSTVKTSIGVEVSLPVADGSWPYPRETR